jgi:6-phosphogluconolactonase
MAGLPVADAHEEVRSLFVAGRAGDEREGLYRWRLTGGAWHGKQLARVVELSALAVHPFQPVVYGLSAAGDEGRIYAWHVPVPGASDDATLLNDIFSGGADACHVAVDPEGRTLVVVNYAHGSIAVQKLAADGSFEGPLHVEKLSGSSVDAERQAGPHPHQAIFHDDRLYVTDLGADLLREYKLDAHRLASDALTPVRETALPPGTGPRHAVVLPDGRIAISGELASTLVVGRPGTDRDTWVIAPSTRRVGPAKTRYARNYPGDIQSSGDGRLIYIANRGHDTIATFDVTGPQPQLVSEVDAGVAWPQHLMVAGGSLLVAGWDSSRVVALPLAAGRPGDARALFDCPGAAWLLAPRNTTSVQR